MEIVVVTIISGLVLGSLYALMASGLSLIWTALGVFNYSHGPLMAFGAVVTWTFLEKLGFSLFPAAIIGIVSAALIGAIVERFLVRQFYGNKNLLLLSCMTTLTSMIIIEKSIQIIWGSRLKLLPRLAEGEISIFGAVISAHEGLIILISPLILLFLWRFMVSTKIGRSMRAVGQNHEMAYLIGINVPKTYLLVFSISTGLAGLSGVLLGGIRFVLPTMGAEPLLKAMTVIIFGGLGSLGATTGAAFVFGMLEAVLVQLVGLYWTPSLLFLLLIIVLVFRPQGLFGRK